MANFVGIYKDKDGYDVHVSMDYSDIDYSWNENGQMWAIDYASKIRITTSRPHHIGVWINDDRTTIPTLSEVDSND